MIESIQQFQLGENAQGKRLLERAKAEDADYVQALRLFIKEEQRHSELLGRFLATQGASCLRRHWVHAAFRRLRGLAGLEMRMRVLATAEVLAIPYYTALRDATGSPLLRSICSRILAEETEHLRFQAFTFGHLGSRRMAMLRTLIRIAASRSASRHYAAAVDAASDGVPRRRIFAARIVEAKPYRG